MKNPHRTIPWLLILAAFFAVLVPVHAAFAQAPIQFRIHEKIGFKSERLLQEHFRKHAREFGKVNQREYLLMAQQLRDRPLDMNILESVRRKDGVISRFDRKTGAFIAFERNLVIRTFFKPAEGERYFVRQTKRGSRRR